MQLDFGWLPTNSRNSRYQLDTPDKPRPYEGKSVKVTGTIEEDAKLLHVESIEEVTA